MCSYEESPEYDVSALGESHPSCSLQAFFPWYRDNDRLSAAFCEAAKCGGLTCFLEQCADVVALSLSLELKAFRNVS